MLDNKLPVVFEQAIQALAACRTIDEALYFRDKAEALKAWAKLYKLKPQEREARALTLHAFRRMAEIAEEQRPTKTGSARRGLPSTTKGARSLLIESGLTRRNAEIAIELRKLSNEKFSELANRPMPPTPRMATQEFYETSESWKALMVRGTCLTGFRSFCRRFNAADLAHGLSADEANRARAAAIEVSDWLDEFERHLQKAKK